MMSSDELPAEPGGKASSQPDKPALSILIPVLNEAENIDLLIPQVISASSDADIDAEILIVDGGSTDGTQARVEEWAGRAPVRLVRSDARKGLSGDILRGAESARADVVLVMDGDLSHPPESIPGVARPVLDGTHDFALGSRYVKGGGTPGWPWWRRFVSKSATALAWPVVSVADPMSGFFAVGRKDLLTLGAGAVGFKIAMEILAQGDDSLRVIEVPIVFHDRLHGESKFGMKEVGTYVKQLCALAGSAVSAGCGLRFGIVGLGAAIADMLIFNLLLIARFDLLSAHVIAFAAAAAGVYVMNSRWALAGAISISRQSKSLRLLRFSLVCVPALLLRGVVLAALVESAHWPPQVAIVLAVLATSVVSLVGTAFFVFPQAVARGAPTIRWRVAAICIVLYAVVLRLVCGAVMDLIPQEAYYWMYARNLDIGYLDHPPMVAWLIALGTLVFGDSEIGVRAPACLCWIVAAFFMFRLTRNMFDKTSASRAVLLIAALPIYFLVGLIMTPDAPLYACWAGALYFLERALLGGRARAWLGLGVCVGLGMLSKYTIALLAPATLAFLLIDRGSRRWLLRPQPYLAVVIAALLFSPVIIWNACNEWASFVFQGPRRWAEDPEFSLHLLIGSAMIVITPVGLIGVFHALLTKGSGDPEGSSCGKFIGPRRLFALVFTLVPLSIFVYFSLKNAPKLNWTGPVWLAAIPLLSWGIGSHAGQTVSRFTQWGRRLWMPTIVASVLLFGAGLYVIILGLPGLPDASGGMPVPVAWQEMGDRVDLIVSKVTRETGRKPVVTGMNDYFISSEIAFYDGPDNDGPENTSGQHLVGSKGLMWAIWSPRDKLIGRNVIMFSFGLDDLTHPRLDKHFTRLGPVVTEPINKAGRTATKLHWRTGYNYTGHRPPPKTKP